MRRRINQARLIHKIKYQELQRKSKATSPSKSTFGTNGTRPPIPPKANLPPLQQPKVSAISSDISKQFHEETGFPDCAFDEMFHEPYIMTLQETNNVKELQTILESNVNNMLAPSTATQEEPMTPFVINISATQNVASTDSTAGAESPESELLVEFGEPSNLVPLQAEFDEPLVPSDYDAYGGYAGIADSSSTVVNW